MYNNLCPVSDCLKGNAHSLGNHQYVRLNLAHTKELKNYSSFLYSATMTAWKDQKCAVLRRDLGGATQTVCCTQRATMNTTCTFLDCVTVHEDGVGTTRCDQQDFCHNSTTIACWLKGNAQDVDFANLNNACCLANGAMIAATESSERLMHTDN